MMVDVRFRIEPHPIVILEPTELVLLSPLNDYSLKKGCVPIPVVQPPDSGQLMKVHFLLTRMELDFILELLKLEAHVGERRRGLKICTAVLQ